MGAVTRQFDMVHSDLDLHVNPAWWPIVFQVDGWFTGGSPNVYVNSRQAIRVGDGGVHIACCGPQTFVAATGSPNVFCNSVPLVRELDATLHCGLSPGSVNAGLCSPNVHAN